MDVDSIDSLSSAQSSSASQPPRKIITVIHKETTLPGQVGHQLEKMGYELEIRAPIFGDALPTCFEQYAGALVFGGPMSVNDDEPYLHQEMDWIRQVLAAGLPYLGICLGAQLLAKVLGADVNRHENAVEEIGYYPIFATEEGQSLFSDRMEVYQWHNEGFELPEGAVRLASGKDFPNQAFRWGDRTYAIQFHPEMTADMVDFWTTAGADLLGAPNAQSRCQHILGHQKHGGAVNRWLETFLNNWLPSAT
ncbi:MAG: glutamine amidotransferase [Cyanobacteria bacterium J06573_11]